MYKAIVLLIVSFFFVSSAVNCSRKDEQKPSQNDKLTLAVTPWPASAAIFVAQEKGFFKDEGLDLTLQIHPSGHLGLDAVLAGKADLATVGETPIVRAAVSGQPCVIIASICEIERAILIIGRKDKGVSAPPDLKDKRVGVVAGTTADFFLHIYLITSYIDPKEVKIVSLMIDQVAEALLNGEVDAVSTWMPYTTILRDKLDLNATVLQEQSIYTMTWNVVAAKDFAEKNPERIKKFLLAISKANKFIAEHNTEAREVCSIYIGTDSPLFNREWSNYFFTMKLDQSLLLNLEDQARWISEKEGAREGKVHNFLDNINAAGLRTVQSEAVGITGK
jgi:ABC-type nitrate/sulfonate/bicarbonate transport system substrate-binding protein